MSESPKWTLQEGQGHFAGLPKEDWPLDKGLSATGAVG